MSIAWLLGLALTQGSQVVGPPPPPPPPPAPVVGDDDDDEPTFDDPDEPEDSDALDPAEPDDPGADPVELAPRGDDPDGTSGEPTVTSPKVDAEGEDGKSRAATRREERRARRSADDQVELQSERGRETERLYRSRYLRIGGYVQPQYTYRYRRNARPRDQQEFGAGQTRAGIRFFGEPIKHWIYTVHLVIGSQILQPITRVDTVDNDGDGIIDRLSTTAQPTPGLFIEELSVDYRPVDLKGAGPGRSKGEEIQIVSLDLKFGQMRIPFTAQNRSPNSALMFPRRSTPNNVFLFGTDLGGLVKLAIFDDRLDVLGGVYNGTGTAAGLTNERGALYAGRIDINPLGGFDYSEGDLSRGRFKFGVGSGLLYFPTKIFDDAGNDTRTRSRDLRASASFRMQVRGFYLQGEFLRRQRTDSLSALPEIATGAYGQTSFFFPVYKELGMAPVGRFGWTALDQSFDPLVTYYGDAGLALYVGREERVDALRVLLQYVGEVRVTEEETAHGAALQVQLKW